MELTPTLVNVAIFAVVMFSGYLAYARGFTREAFTLITWLLAALVAVKFYGIVEPFIAEAINSAELAKWGAVAVTFVGALVVISIIGSALSSVIANSALGPIDKGAGFLFGAARGLAILAILVIGYDAMVRPENRFEAIEVASGMQVVRETARILTEFAPTEVPPFIADAIGDLLGSAPGQATTDPTVVSQ